MSQSTPTDHEIDVYATEFVLTGDKSKSWRKTFPSSKASNEVIWVKSCAFHKFDKVLVRIGQKQDEIAQNDNKDFDISYEAQVKRCLTILELGTKPKYDKDGNEVAQNLAAAQSAVNELNKMAGHHAAIKQKLEHGLQEDNPIADLLKSISGNVLGPQ